MVSCNIENDIKLIFCIVTLNGSKSYLDRLHFAPVVLLHCVLHFGAHCHYRVTVNRKDSIYKVGLIPACLVPGCIAVLARLSCDFVLDIQNSALVVPGVGKAVHNNNTVRTHSSSGFRYKLLVALRTVRR